MHQKVSKALTNVNSCPPNLLHLTYRNGKKSGVDVIQVAGLLCLPSFSGSGELGLFIE